MGKDEEKDGYWDKELSFEDKLWLFLKLIALYMLLSILFGEWSIVFRVKVLEI